MRITKSEIHGMFNRMIKTMMRHNPKLDYTNWQLDYVSCYGGYVVEQIGENGGVSHPLGMRRRSAAEMYCSMLMVCNALECLEYGVN